METTHSGPTAREFDMLRSQVNRLTDRVIEIDNNGTRGVGTLQVQITEVIKDLSDMKVEIATRFTEHKNEHDREWQNRTRARRWLLGAAISGIAAFCAVITLLIYIIHTVQGH